LPSREDLVRHLEQSPPGTSRRDLARAFRVKGRERTELKRMLRELEPGLASDRPLEAAREPPRVAVLEVTGLDPDGELMARPMSEAHDGGVATRVLLLGGRARGRAPGIGDRVLARLSRADGDDYRGEIIRVLPKTPSRVVGVLERAGDGLRVRPIGERGRGLELRAADAGGAEPGELVVAERIGGRELGLDRGRVIERLGQPGDPRAISLMAAHSFDLPIAFAPETEAEAARARPIAEDRREDFCDLPLVTIDGADARDFDDAVFAAPDDDPANSGGWQVVVAIADVAHYVRPGGALDREARRRGNSVYFPDRVLPMLPAALSNDLCSLRADEDRACLAVRMRFDPRGRKLGHRFVRALMRSRARLTYEQVQAAADGAPDEATAPLLDATIMPLFGAFGALLEARCRRGTLDLDLPETLVRLDDAGRPVAIDRRARLDAHRLIEEFMIAANVSAAEALEQAGWLCMYRVHDRPDPVKLEGLAQLLEQLGLARGRGDLARPRDVARLLERLREHALAPLIGNLLLRAQSQAVYSPRNIGHYGLNLGRYAHFTSPIRRYADLVVHRALIRVLGLGEGGLEPAEGDGHELGAWLSRCERRAMEAERSVRDRFVALLLAERIGSAFEATVASVQRFGLFVQLAETLAEGLVPVSALGREYFVHDPAGHALIGQESGIAFALGDRVRVELVEVDALAGQLTFRILDHAPGAAAEAAARTWRTRAGGRGARGRRRRPTSHR
jgi:ribonuclease R